MSQINVCFSLYFSGSFIELKFSDKSTKIMNSSFDVVLNETQFTYAGENKVLANGAINVKKRNKIRIQTGAVHVVE